MHVLRTDPVPDKNKKAFFLASAYELGFINFLQRHFFKQHLIFGARTVIQGLAPNDHVRIQLEETDQAFAYAVLLPSGLGGVLIADKEYPSQVAIKVVRDMLVEFTKTVPQHFYVNGATKDIEAPYPQLEGNIKKYQNPMEADKLLKLENELGQVQQTLTKTMNDVSSS